MKLQFVSSSKYLGIIEINITIDDKLYTFKCYDSPRLNKIIWRLQQPKFRNKALKELKKESELFKNDRKPEPIKERDPEACPHCRLDTPNYVSGIECPGCGFREWLNNREKGLY